MSSSESEFSDDSDDIVSNEIRETAKNVTLDLLPDKSKRLYVARYNLFKKWCKGKTNSFCEDVLLAYFAHFEKSYAPSSLWATYSMLKCTINTINKIDIGKYKRLTMFLKKKSTGYKAKKAQVFSKDVNKFLNEAPDDVYLGYKTVLIFGIAGALRRAEFINLTVDDVRNLDQSVLFVRIIETKNNMPRSFTITGEFYNVCMKYIQCRPEVSKTNRFFFKYSNGRCVNQLIGVNTIPKIAKDKAAYLKLPNFEGFTGHAFRRTSATLLVDAGDDLTTLQRHGGWKSPGVAFVYVADSLNNKKKICEQISSGIELNNQVQHPISASRTITNPANVIAPARTPSTLSTSLSSYSPVEEKRVLKLKTSNNIVSGNSSSEISTSHQSEEIFLVNEENQENFSVPKLKSQSKNLISPDQVCNKTQYTKVLYHPDVGLYEYNPLSANSNISYVFSNCNVTVNSNGNCIFSNCAVKNAAQAKSIQKN